MVYGWTESLCVNIVCTAHHCNKMIREKAKNNSFFTMFKLHYYSN